MPEKSSGFMQALDQWTQDTVLDPLYEAWRDVESAPDEALDEFQAHLTEVVASVKRAIREKVLESYRNGQQARPQPSYGTADRRSPKAASAPRGAGRRF